MAKSTLDRTPARIKVERLLATLAERPMTAPEIAHALCISQVYANTMIRQLRKGGKIHVKRWTRSEVAGLAPRQRPLYAPGSGPDAPRLPAMTRQERYQKLKADPDRWDRHRARCRARHFKPRPDFAAAWLFKATA